MNLPSHSPPRRVRPGRRRRTGLVAVDPRAPPRVLPGADRAPPIIGLPLPVLVGWIHPYAPFGAPLVDRDQGEAVLAAWLEHVATEPQLPDVMLLPYLPTDGALAQALDAVMARRGGQSACFAQHRRALLAPADDRASYLDQSVGAKKRKELRRQRKRLSDSGQT